MFDLLDSDMVSDWISESVLITWQLQLEDSSVVSNVSSANDWESDLLIWSAQHGQNFWDRLFSIINF